MKSLLSRTIQRSGCHVTRTTCGALRIGWNWTQFLAVAGFLTAGPVRVWSQQKPIPNEVDPYKTASLEADRAVAKPIVIYTRTNRPPLPRLEDLPQKSAVSQYGITWRFETPARVGHYISGDCYVVGPVKIIAIDPKPLYGNEIPE